jgi:hypothetical protein
VLAEVPKAVQFDEIKHLVKRRLGSEIKDHQIRVTLRVLQLGPKPLVRRKLTRYAAVAAARLVRSAEAVLEQISHERARL